MMNKDAIKLFQSSVVPAAKGKHAEQFVHDLAIKTFLTDWCYLNPILPSGRELCDFLVIFDEIAVIWQIKDLKLDQNGKYRKREVDKNLRQLAGAYRQLFTLQAAIELANPRRGKEKFQPNSIKEIYLISALLGEGEDEFSLIEVINDRVIHTFTKDFIQIILSELDTVEDFTRYLRAKEDFLKLNQNFIISGGEEELLTVYLGHNKSFDEFKGATDIFIEEGCWDKFKNSEKYQNKKKEDKISYGWDGIIGRIHEGSGEYEKIARDLARPNRFQRRVLSKAYYEAYVKADQDTIHNIFRRFFVFSGITYCFLFFDRKIPRHHRITTLQGTCYIARGVYKNAKVIGIATEKQASEICSYDFVILDLPSWTKEDQEIMEKAQKDTGILLNPEMTETQENEYPA
ncbi:MAG: hypothetical protein NTZ34_00165 [Chloroflexi bacterium]|nr:hypothetical protein [Chloroflexota bacterium]